MTDTRTSASTLASQFCETVSMKNHPARCVDGRPLEGLNGQEGGAQMLGASLLPVVLHVIAENSPLDDRILVADFGVLEAEGYGLGVHRGHHKHPEAGKSDCGFADNLTTIINRAKSKAQGYAQALRSVAKDHESIRNAFGGDMDAAVSGALQLLDAFDPTHILLTGEPMIAQAESIGAVAGEVTGDHAEQVAYVNVKDGVTFDVNAANANSFQGFSMDLVQSMDQAQTLGVERNTAGALSLLLYMATEEVLVEDKGKPALPVVVH